jgi:hypothetical protein
MHEGNDYGEVNPYDKIKELVNEVKDLNDRLLALVNYHEIAKEDNEKIIAQITRDVGQLSEIVNNLSAAMQCNRIVTPAPSTGYQPPTIKVHTTKVWVE